MIERTRMGKGIDRRRRRRKKSRRRRRKSSGSSNSRTDKELAGAMGGGRGGGRARPLNLEGHQTASERRKMTKQETSMMEQKR